MMKPGTKYFAVVSIPTAAIATLLLLTGLGISFFGYGSKRQRRRSQERIKLARKELQELQNVTETGSPNRKAPVAPPKRAEPVRSPSRDSSRKKSKKAKETQALIWRCVGAENGSAERSNGSVDEACAQRRVATTPHLDSVPQRSPPRGNSHFRALWSMVSCGSAR